VLDVAFDYTGQYLLSASADSTARVYNATTHQLITKLEGHEGEISKVGDMNKNRRELYCINAVILLLTILLVSRLKHPANQSN